jgi:hypothetical protein
MKPPSAGLLLPKPAEVLGGGPTGSVDGVSCGWGYEPPSQSGAAGAEEEGEESADVQHRQHRGGGFVVRRPPQMAAQQSPVFVEVLQISVGCTPHLQVILKLSPRMVGEGFLDGGGGSAAVLRYQEEVHQVLLHLRLTSASS